ncbi:MAG: site-specific DNA-methyltransferase [Nitrospira sp.]|nr:site-specific DNA-methyltransferase [Nitrospira sp.]MCY3954604.1 site-specific DNA-methyltransferase [Nitrospira sp.]
MKPDSANETIVSSNYLTAFNQYLREKRVCPLLLQGDALTVLQDLRADSIDCVVTSPPYWGKREYHNGGIGLEADHREYIRNVTLICKEVKRVLKPTGSFWLNIGDSYTDKRLVGIPWRVALTLMDTQQWIMRNSVIWNKVKSGMDSTKNRLGNVHELFFHFVKQATGYFYNMNAIRSKPRDAKIVNGAVVTATGVSGVRYKRQIELSTSLSDSERDEAFQALNTMLEKVAAGKVSDFRMILRSQQRATHSDSKHVSGRAKELHNKGFYFLQYHPNGSKPTDVWDIIPEDTQGRTAHFSPYPVDLCRIPILATCPSDGIVLDPFCGTGTTLLAARNFARKSVGIDVSRQYLWQSWERCADLL